MQIRSRGPGYVPRWVVLERLHRIHLQLVVLPEEAGNPEPLPAPISLSDGQALLIVSAVKEHPSPPSGPLTDRPVPTAGHSPTLQAVHPVIVRWRGAARLPSAGAACSPAGPPQANQSIH